MEIWIENTALLRLAADAAMATLIWLVQLIIYPAFGTIESDRFIGWHHRYMRAVSFIVIPLMILQAGCITVQLLLEPTVWTWISLAGAGTAWGVTFCCSVPCHNALQAQGNRPELVHRIVRTNGLRTVGWSLTLLAGWIQILT